MTRLIEKPKLVDYQGDYYAWVGEQIELLGSGRLGELDVARLIEELRDLGNSERDQIDARLTVLLTHLLKWEFQSERRSPSWRASIVEQRTRIARILARSPSLKRYPAQSLDEQYEIARLRAAGETGLAEDALPVRCPYPVASALAAAFWPGAN